VIVLAGLVVLPNIAGSCDARTRNLMAPPSKKDNGSRPPSAGVEPAPPARLSATKVRRALQDALEFACLWESSFLEQGTAEAKQHVEAFLRALVSLTASYPWDKTPLARAEGFIIWPHDIDVLMLRRRLADELVLHRKIHHCRGARAAKKFTFLRLRKMLEPAVKVVSWQGLSAWWDQQETAAAVACAEKLGKEEAAHRCWVSKVGGRMQAADRLIERAGGPSVGRMLRIRRAIAHLVEAEKKPRSPVEKQGLPVSPTPEPRDVLLRHAFGLTRLSDDVLQLYALQLVGFSYFRAERAIADHAHPERALREGVQAILDANPARDDDDECPPFIPSESEGVTESSPLQGPIDEERKRVSQGSRRRSRDVRRK
jgi:hypothetical protein